MRTGEDLTAAEKALVRQGFHTLLCSPREMAGKGRFRFVTNERPDYGSDDCVCHGRTIRYNGVAI